MKNKTSNRRLIFQLTAVVVLIAIAYAMTIIGRGHTVYLDNKKLEYNGKTYDTPYKVVVLVDGEQVAKLYDRERGSATCIGRDHREEGRQRDDADLHDPPAQEYGRHHHQSARLSRGTG